MKWSIPGVLLIFIIYLLFFPMEFRPEIGLRPTWKLDVDVADTSEIPQSRNSGAVPFHLDRLFGYVSLDGDLLLKGETPFGIALDSKRYVSFESVSRNLTVHDNLGRVISDLKISGYPMLLDGRFLVISTNRSEIAEVGTGETPLWKREYTTIITDIDAGGGLIALGLLDSRVQVLDQSGEVALDLDLKGSRINTVYGCALSDDATKVAVIHGIDPQYVSVVDMTDGALEIANSRLDAEYRTSRFLSFFSADQYLLIEGDGVLKILDLEKNSEYQVSIPGSFADAGSLESDNLIWIVTENDNAAGFLVVEPPNRVLFRVPLAAPAKAFTAADGVMLGIEGNLCMVQKEHR